MSGKILKGFVVCDVANKTISVLVESKIFHKKYEKRIKRSNKYLVHDENNKYLKGDNVSIIESRPISKLKRWTILEENKGN
jgi:small subunit ribosomal protein S17